MDAFYASVEQRDNPELRGKPVAVGGGGARRGRGGELRGAQVRRPLGHAVGDRQAPLPRARSSSSRASTPIARSRSRSARSSPTTRRSSSRSSLDEAYLDVTEDLKGIGIATRIAEEIRARIRAETGLTASAGVSYNKFLAKLASDQNKPDGLCVVTPGAAARPSSRRLPVKRFHGVGPKTAEKMARLGIETGADLKAQSLEFLAAPFRLERATIITTSPAASATARSRPTAPTSRSAPRTRSSRI